MHLFFFTVRKHYLSGLIKVFAPVYPLMDTIAQYPEITYPVLIKNYQVIHAVNNCHFGFTGSSGPWILNEFKST